MSSDRDPQEKSNASSQTLSAKNPAPDRKPMKMSASILLGLGLPCLIFLLGGLIWISQSGQSQKQEQQALSTPTSSLGIQPDRPMGDIPNIPEGVFQYDGALAFDALRSEGIDRKITQIHPKFQPQHHESVNQNGNPGSGTAIAALINGEISFAQSTRALEDEDYRKAKERNFTLAQVAVGLDSVIFYTHPDINVSRLSINQLQDIFQGKIANWKEIGGSDIAIVPISLEPAATAIIKQLFASDGSEIGSHVKIVRDFDAAVEKTAKTPGAISYISASKSTALAKNIQQTIRPLSLAKHDSNEYISPLLADGQLNKAVFQDGTYPMTRRLFMVIRRDGTVHEKAGTAYANLLLSQEGQQILEKAGFVPLR